MADKILVNDQKGNFEDLKIEAIDPSDIETNPQDPRFGLPKFLSWSLYRDAAREEYYEAIGKDGKVYKIVSDEIKPPKKGKVVIT